MNPFKYGQVVSSDDFCPRPELMAQLTRCIKTGQNTVLQGERRTGKTSLIHEAIRKCPAYKEIYIDLLEIKDIDGLCRRMIKAIVSLERKSGMIEKILHGISQLRPSLSFDPLTGMPLVTLDPGLVLKPDSLEGLFDLIQEVHSRHSVVVVFDEFQDVLNLKTSRETLAVLRSRIQFLGTIPFVFSGSIRNRMNDIFTNSRSPFFKSAICFEVGPLDRKPFRAFLKAKFAEGNRIVEDSVLEKAFELACDLPGDVQQFCGALWDVTESNSSIDLSNASDAIKLIFSREYKGYEAILVQLTAIQLRCLSGLARLGGNSPYSGAFLRGVGVSSPASAGRALKRMEHLKIIYTHSGELRFANPFFREWLIWKNL